MSGLRAALARLGGLLGRRRRREREFREELESHLAMHVEDNLRAGMGEREARRQARLALGGVEATRQAYRDRASLPAVEHLLQDVRFALRQLARSRGLTATAVLTLGLALGVLGALGALVDAVLLEPLPYSHPHRLVEVTESTPGIPRANLSWLDYLDWRRMNTVLASLDVHRGRSMALATADGGVELLSGVRVSAGFFRTLGVAPALGRDFAPGEGEDAPSDAVILGHDAWRTRFGGRRDVVGRTLVLSDQPRTVVGVLPEGFHFAPRGDAEVWVPLHPTDGCDLRRSCHPLGGVGRLRDGVTVADARAELEAIAARLEERYPDSNRGQGASVLPLTEALVGQVRPVLVLLLGGAVLLVGIACVNVVSLLLVRSEGRRRELAVRSTMGASGGRLVRQLATEAVVLVAAASLLGVLVAAASLPLLLALVPDGLRSTLPFLEGARLGPRVLAAGGGVALLAAALFTLAPALRLRGADLRAGLAEGGRGSSGRVWRRLGMRLVVVELATAMVLLAGAGLLGRSLQRLLDVELGFRPDRLATVRVGAPGPEYADPERQVQLAQAVVERVGRVPGVESVGVTSVPPVSFNGNTTWLRFVGRPYSGEHNEVNMRDVSAGYLETIGATLLRGRTITEADTAAAPGVAVVNRTLAELYFPGQDPIGRQFGDVELTPGSIRTIVGVVGDVREGPLDAEVWPAVYYPIAQSPDSFFAVLVRTGREVAPRLPEIVAAVRDAAPGLGVLEATVVRERIVDSPAAYLQRSSAALVGGFAGLALLLAVVGLYGVVAYAVGLRTREIGLRLAMGAQRRAVYGMVLGEAGRLAAAGVLLGLAGAVTAAHLARGVLFDTRPWDLPTLAAVAAVLAAAALLASWLPARRAAAVDPVEALRTE